MNDHKLNNVLTKIAANFNTQRRNPPDSQEATDAREENQRLFALLDSHGIKPTPELLARAAA